VSEAKTSLDSRVGDSESTFHRNCFACGAGNPDGLQLRFSTNGESNSATIVLDERFQGYEKIAQGGIVATILDTAMVQLLRHVLGGNPMTARLDIRFHNATPLRESLTVAAHIAGSRGKVHWATAEIVHGTTCCATAQGVFTILRNAK
jgi:acyl-coenzyme A thioesterase PaaI-like protein